MAKVRSRESGNACHDGEPLFKRKTARIEGTLETLPEFSAARYTSLADLRAIRQLRVTRGPSPHCARGRPADNDDIAVPHSGKSCGLLQGWCAGTSAATKRHPASIGISTY